MPHARHDLRRVTFALALSLTMAACARASHADASAAASPSPFAAASGSAAGVLQVSQGVDRLVATSFSDPLAIDGALSTRLGPADRLDGFVVQTAAQGTLAGVAIRQIELRRSAEGSGSTVLLFSLADGGVAFDGADWPGAVPQPPSPHAAGSRASWSFERTGAVVVLGLDASQRRLIQVSVRKR